MKSGHRRPKRKKEKGKQNMFDVMYGKNVLSALMLEVSIRSGNGAPSRKGCAVNG